MKTPATAPIFLRGKGLVLRFNLSKSFISGKTFYHGFHGFHGWETPRFLSVPSVKSVDAFLWLRLAELRPGVLASLRLPGWAGGEGLTPPLAGAILAPWFWS
jgi:hypothetical protein